MLSELNHPNIITLYGTASNDRHLYIVLGVCIRHIYLSLKMQVFKLLFDFIITQN